MCIRDSFKASQEIYEKLEGDEETHEQTKKPGQFGWILAQILALDIVFSLDSVITAVGMAPHVPIMVIEMIVAVVVMLIFAEGISGFIEKHPSLKVLALSFLLTIGLLLTAEAFDQHVSKGYVYFAMAFSLLVEMFRGRVVDVTHDTLMVEVSGTEGKIEAFIDLMRPYGIIELARTGRIALVRGTLGEKGE